MVKSKMSVSILSACLITGTALVTGCSTHNESTPPAYMVSSSITWQVKEKLLRDPMIHSNRISVSTYKDTVTLSGSVDNSAQEDRAIDLARSVRGVKYVVDDLEIRGH